MNKLFKNLAFTFVLFFQFVYCVKQPKIPNIFKKNNFSWIKPNIIAGMRMPTTKDQIKALTDKKINVGLVVTLTEKKQGPNPEIFSGVGIERLLLPIPDFHTPTIDQVNTFIKKADDVLKTKKKATVMHCAGGLGRTGTMLACWLIANDHMDSSQAIEFVRKIRPGSIETDDQENFVENFYCYFHGKVPDILAGNNFSWIEPNVIAGMAKPKNTAQIKALADINVGLVVTLTESEKEGPDPEIFQGVDIERLLLPIPDFNVPTIEQVNRFVSKSTKIYKTKKKATVVHCWGGKGRTGTMLACWLIANKNMNPIDAILFVRKRRPGSIETKEQIKFIGDYYIFLHKKELIEWQGEILLKKLEKVKEKHSKSSIEKSIQGEALVAEFLSGVEEQVFIEKLNKLKEALISLNKKLNTLSQKILKVN